MTDMPILRSILISMLFCAASAAIAGDTEDIQQMLKNKQYTQALERADRFLIKNSKDAQVRFMRGIALTELNRTDEAIKAFSSLAEDYPQLPEPYNNLAVLYAQQNQLDKARAALLMSIQTNPAYATAHENLGDLYARLASQSYDKALQLENNNNNVRTKLTLVRELFSRNPSTTMAAANKPLAPVNKAVPVTVAMAQQPVATPAKPAAQPVKQPPVVAATKPVQTPPLPAVPAKPASQPAPLPTPPAPTPVANNQQAVMSSVRAWAEAWSKRNVNGYLASYDSREFHVPGNQKFADWAKERKNRIMAPKSIDVSVSDMKVDFVDDNTAKVRFRQHYKSEILNSAANKTLTLKKSGNRWLIVDERT